MKCSSCLIVFAVIVALSTTVECGKNKKKTGNSKPDKTKPIKVTGTQNKPNPFGSSITDFSLDFLKALHKSESSSGTLQKNLVFSPSNIFRALLLLSFGANGHTKSQLYNALHLQTVGKVNEGYKTWKSLRVPGVLEADRLYYDTEIQMKQPIKALLTDDIHQVAMSDASTINQVNKWVSSMTQGKISKLLDDKLDDVKVLLLSVVYMRAEWKRMFEKENTQKSEFKTHNGEKKVDMMVRMRTRVPYVDSASLKSQVVSLEYKDSPLSFLVFLPNVTAGQTVDELISSLNRDEVKKTVDSMETEDINLYLPKFTVKADIDLIPMLKTLGVEDVFTDAADLSSFTDQQLYVKKALQKVILEVDEKGTTAAAATAIEAVPMRMTYPVTFKADHPFVYMIYDKFSHMPLFVGVMMDPTQG